MGGQSPLDHPAPPEDAGMHSAIRGPRANLLDIGNPNLARPGYERGEERRVDAWPPLRSVAKHRHVVHLKELAALVEHRDRAGIAEYPGRLFS